MCSTRVVTVHRAESTVNDNPLIAGMPRPLLSKELPGADCEDQIRSVCSKNGPGEDIHRNTTLARSAVCTSPDCMTIVRKYLLLARLL